MGKTGKASEFKWTKEASGDRKRHFIQPNIMKILMKLILNLLYVVLEKYLLLLQLLISNKEMSLLTLDFRIQSLLMKMKIAQYKQVNSDWDKNFTPRLN